MAAIIRGPWQARAQFEPGQLVAVMTSDGAHSYHWLRIGEDGPVSLHGARRALCGARPGGYIDRWTMADENARTEPGAYVRGPQVMACSRCEAKRGAERTN